MDKKQVRPPPSAPSPNQPCNARLGIDQIDDAPPAYPDTTQYKPGAAYGDPVDLQQGLVVATINFSYKIKITIMTDDYLLPFN